MVEVPRPTALEPRAEVRAQTARLPASCMVVDVVASLLRTAARLTSGDMRTLDAIHLASALRIDPTS